MPAPADSDRSAEKTEIVDDPERSRYELRLDGEVAVVADYRRDGDQVSFTHTGTDPRLRGRGLAGQLIERALADAKRRRRRGPALLLLRQRLHRRARRVPGAGPGGAPRRVRPAAGD